MRSRIGGSLALVLTAPANCTSTARLCVSPIGNELQAGPNPSGPGQAGVPNADPMFKRCAVRTGPDRSSSPPKTRCTTPNDPVHEVPLKLLPHVPPVGAGGTGKPVSCFTAQVTVVGHGPACAGMVTVYVRVLLAGGLLLSLPTVQLPPDESYSWILPRFPLEIVVSKLTVSVAVHEESL